MPAEQPQLPDLRGNPDPVLDHFEALHIDSLDEHSDPKQVVRVSIALTHVMLGLAELHQGNSERVADAASGVAVAYGRMIQGVMGFHPDAELSAQLDSEGSALGETFLRDLSNKEG